MTSSQDGSDIEPDLAENTVGSDDKNKLSKSLSGYVFMAFVLSVATNLLLLVSPLYMIQVYDRVLTSGSVSTLLSLSVIAVFLLWIYAFAEAGRRRALAIYGRNRMEGHLERIGKWVLSRERFTPEGAKKDAPTFQDVSRIQSAINAGSTLPFFDLPFTPLFLGLLFLLHPLIGMIGLVGAVLLVLIALATEMMTSKRHNNDQKSETMAQSFITEVSKSSNAVISMGMRSRLLNRWLGLQDKASDSALSTSSVSGLLAGLSKSFRQILQSLVLGTGAYLTLQQEMSPGAIVAGSIIMGRGLAPIDQIVGGWKQLALINKSWGKLKKFSKETRKTGDEEEFEVKTINTGLVCRNVSIAPPGAERPVLENLSLTVDFGKVVAVVGASGAGKSTLLQCLSGVWPLMTGEITLGNRSISEWQDEDRGRFIGYLPQRIELIPGSVADNISRFQPDRYQEIEGIAALLGYQELFMSLPKAYTTIVGDTGQQVSAGQRQAIGLARACFGDTKLLLLDEPTANLDVNLARSFMGALQALKGQGKAVIITTHDSRILPAIDHLYSIQNGRFVELDNPAKGQNLHAVSTPLKGGASS